MFRKIDESARLRALEFYKILDSLPEREFDDITRLASMVCETPVALISLVDGTRQWFKARHGTDLSETPRSMAFCSKTIEQDGVYIVNHADQHPEFRSNPLVTGDPNIRFYAGAVLKTSRGEALGSICVIDNKPRELSATQLEALSALSRQVMALIEARNIQNHYLDARDSAAESERLATQVSANLETFIRKAPVGIAIMSGPDHVFLKANDAYQDLVGGRDLVGIPIREAFQELSHEEYFDRLDEVYRTGGAFVAREAPVVLTQSDGSAKLLYLDFTFSPQLTDAGEISGVSIIVIDVTDRVIARKKSEENEKFLQLITDSIPAHIAYVDQDLKLRFANQSIREFFKYTGEEMEQLHISKLLSPEQYAERLPAYMRVLGGEKQVVLVHSYDADGQVHLTQNSAIPNIRPDGEIDGFVVIAYNRTEEERMKRELEQAIVQTEAANSAKSAFLANMSHEIRSPLGAIMGFTSLVRESLPPDGEAASYLSVVERNSQQVLRIVDDILDLSKVEAGKMLIETMNFSLLEVLADFASLMGFKARENGIEFSMQAETAVPDPVVSDPTRLRQILTNVVGNAIKFTTKGRVSLIISYRDGLLTFKVVDTGIGISSAEIQHLFQAFHQADVSTTRRFGGTGLGLTLTKRLAQMMGGDFWLESSEVSKGSVFIAQIRVELNASSRMVDPGSFSYGQPAVPAADLFKDALKGARILVVDDSPDNQILIKTILKRSGAVADVASDGIEGVEAAFNSAFDAVLMDVQMPRMDGYEAVQKLRAMDFDKPIIAITAHAMKDERENCLRAGYSDYVAKPIDKLKLIDTLRFHLQLQLEKA